MSENVLRSPVDNQRPRKPARGLLGQVSTIIFQPAKFFAEMPAIQYNRQWAWIGLLLLIIIGLNVVQQYDADHASPSPNDMTDPMMGNMEMGGDFMGEPFMGGGMGGMEGTSDNSSGVSTSTKWEMALVAGAGVVFIWFAQALVLSQVSLFKGQAPSLSDNLQIVIWAAVPLGLMALFQMFFRWTGGTIGQAGLQGLIVETSFYQSANPFLQAVLKTLSTNLTLFWVWSLILIYVGARHVLHGQTIPSILAVVMWVVLLVAVPSILNPPQPEDDLSFNVDEFGGFPQDEFFPDGDGEFEMFPSDGDEFGEFSGSEEFPFDDNFSAGDDEFSSDNDDFEGFPMDEESTGGDGFENPLTDDDFMEEPPSDGDIPRKGDLPTDDEANQ